MSEVNDWERILKDLAARGEHPEAARQPEDIGTLVAGPHPGIGLAERFRAKGPVTDEQAALLEEAHTYMEELIDRKLHLFASYVATILKRQA